MAKGPCIPCEERKERILEAIHRVRAMKRRVLGQEPLPPRPSHNSHPEGGAPEGAWKPRVRIYTKEVDRG